MAYATQMRPSDIRFIQSDVSPELDGRDLLVVFEKLVRGRLQVDDLALVEVASYKGLYFAIDGSSQLLLFKVSHVSVKVVCNISQTVIM